MRVSTRWREAASLSFPKSGTLRSWTKSLRSTTPRPTPRSSRSRAPKGSSWADPPAAVPRPRGRLPAASAPARAESRGIQISCGGGEAGGTRARESWEEDEEGQQEAREDAQERESPGL